MNNRNDRGFTLVEILVSVFILGIGLTTLVGMQTNLINAYTRESDLTRAALYAQYIMALTEIDREVPQLGSSSGDLKGELKDRGYFDDFDLLDDDLEGWSYEQEVTSVDLPTADGVLRRIDLKIIWSKNVADRYGLVYFFRLDPSTQQAAAASDEGEQ